MLVVCECGCIRQECYYSFHDVLCKYIPFIHMYLYMNHTMMCCAITPFTRSLLPFMMCCAITPFMMCCAFARSAITPFMMCCAVTPFMMCCAFARSAITPFMTCCAFTPFMMCCALARSAITPFMMCCAIILCMGAKANTGKLLALCTQHT